MYFCFAFLCCYCFWSRVSCGSYCLQIDCHWVEDDLELLNFLPLILESWDCCKPHHDGSDEALGMEPRASCPIGKSSTHLATPSALQQVFKCGSDLVFWYPKPHHGTIHLISIQPAYLNLPLTPNPWHHYNCLPHLDPKQRKPFFVFSVLESLASSQCECPL